MPSKDVPRCKKCNNHHFNYLACPHGRVLTDPIQLQPSTHSYKVSSGWGHNFPGGVNTPWGRKYQWHFAPQQHGGVTYPTRPERRVEREVKTKELSTGFGNGTSLVVPDKAA